MDILHSKFVIISSFRSGSTYLRNVLNQHPNIKCYGELFNLTDFTPPVNVKDSGYRFLKKNRELDPLEYLQEAYQNFEEKTQSVGFKILEFQNNEVLNYVLNDKSIKKIVLRRSDLLASYISFRIALKTKVWNFIEEKKIQTEDEKKIQFDPDDFAVHCMRYNSHFNKVMEILSLKRQPFIEIIYENFIKFFQENINYITEFLKVNQFTVSYENTKQNVRDLEFYIENLKEYKDFAQSYSRYGENISFSNFGNEETVKIFMQGLEWCQEKKSQNYNEAKQTTNQTTNNFPTLENGYPLTKFLKKIIKKI